jgi:tubulysin polyketide synthase-like protein
MNAQSILAELGRRRITLRAEGDQLIAKPLSTVPPELRALARQHKAELLLCLRAEQDRRTEALALLQRLKTYTLPPGRTPVARKRFGSVRSRAREMAQRVEPLKDASPEIILHALQDFERGLIALGGAPDPELAEAVGRVTAAFPGARLVEVRKDERRRRPEQTACVSTIPGASATARRVMLFGGL